MASDAQTTIIRTERGLTIAGTRITIYDVMDHLVAGWPPHLIPHWLPLTEEQLNAVMAYIEENRAAVDAEYQEVVRTAAEVWQYWEERNQEHFARVTAMQPKPGQEELWRKLQAQKARHAAEF